MIILKKIRALLGKERTIKKLYEKHDYLTAYARHSDIRAKKDPKSAIGGKWDIIGPLQFEFLRTNGLLPHHTLLDYGCGTLRGGRFFIKYLNEGNYFGLDISGQIIRHARMLLEREGLSHKKPILLLNEDLDLAFNDIPGGKKFDFILAQSVFTHLHAEHITEIFANLHKVMHQDTVFFFTFEPGDEYLKKGYKDFMQPISFFENLCTKHGLNFERMEGYPHPSRQRMFKACYR